jgi:hypothetical protein
MTHVVGALECPAVPPDFVTMNAEAAASANLIERVYLGELHVFEFYEPEPGHIFYSESGSIAHGPITRLDGRELRRMLPVDVFKRLAPNRPVPSHLAAAQDRAQERAKRMSQACEYSIDTTSTEPIASQTPTTESAVSAPSGNGNIVRPAISSAEGTNDCTYESFQQFCWDGDESYCWKDLAWAFVDTVRDVESARGVVCSRVGTTRFEMYVDGAPRAIYDVPQGYWRVFYEWDWSCFIFCWTTDHRFKFNVPYTGSVFQFGATIWNERETCGP